MTPRKGIFSVQVLNAAHQAIDTARVSLQDDQGETIRLFCEAPQGIYRAENPIPKGEYVLTVEKKPFETDHRSVFVDGTEQQELFILRRKGDAFFYRGKVKVPFQPLENQFALLVPKRKAPTGKSKEKQTFSLKERENIARQLIEKHGLQRQKQFETFAKDGAYICAFPAKASQKDKMTICGEIEEAYSQAALPILQVTEKYAALLTSQVMVMFADYVEEDEVKKLARKYKFTVQRKISTLGNLYRFNAKGAPTYALLDSINALAEEEEVVFAEPNLAYIGEEEDAITPTDFLFPEQWDHQLINTPNAWQFLNNISNNRTFGNANVLLAVVDSGVDPNHGDFSGTVSDGSSKIYQAFDFANRVANNNSRSSDHGTCCASAAASMTNNASAVAGTNEGVSGVAGNVRLLTIRRDWPSTEADYADMYLWAGGFDPESDDEDFPAQLDRGADIMTNSIGHPGTGSPISGTMTAVFDKLTGEGRGGKGVLMYFSAANNTSDNDVVFDRPWGMYNRCFSIAASTLANDGVTEIHAPYSNFSSVTEVCAPSHDAYIGGAPLHNPTANYAPYTATDSGAPNGHGTVGRPTAQTTLSAAANAGSNTLSLSSVAGLSNGQALMINTPGSGITEAHIINNINNGTNQVTLNRNLFNNHPNGTGIFAAAPDYRSNFGGTSHATPLCAGVAALMLSANPQLTWTQVRDIIRNTAVKINVGETNANGRWQDINGNLSNSAAYDGNPVFSKFYGFGRINAAAAVREAGWDIELVTSNLNFNDVPAGETTARAVRFNVRSLWASNFNMTAPGAPFETPLGTSANLGTSADANQVREVYLWVTYTGTSVGDQITMADGFSVTVTHPQTEQQWVIPITANTIARETTAVMLCLDQSGSMDFPSGIGSAKRIDILRFSANILADVIQEGNGMGIVSFDQDPHDVLDFVGPLGPATPFDVDRTNIKAAISGFNPNLNGSTAIGDGIERAQLRLNPVSGFTNKATIVFTDGKETDAKYISEVGDAIHDRMFAIGLGKAENIEPAALDAIVNANGGYLLLTDELDANSIYKLSKYFLQILAGVNNEEVVVDPDGTLFPGQEHRIPFVLNEADITSDVILMLPQPQLIDFYLETPNGHVLTPSDNNVLPGLTYNFGNNVAYYRLNLPLPLSPGEREGKWHAILRINEKYGKYGRDSYMKASHLSHGYGSLATSGVPYSLLVHAYSSLRMQSHLTQDHKEPGATIDLHVNLTQFGIPMETPATVTAILTPPTGIQRSLTFQSVGGGAYAAQVKTDVQGVYTFRIMASGTTFRGEAFTREQVRTGAVWQGGNRPVPGTDRPGRESGKEELCRLLSCLLSTKNLTPEFRERLRKLGIDLDGMLACLKKYCAGGKDQRSAALLDRLQADYATVLKTYDELLQRG